MKKFILLTFGFLGFAFYQMSGGADFVPASERIAATQSADVPAVKVAEIPNVQPKPEPILISEAAPNTAVDPLPQIRPVSEGASVTRVALNLTSRSDVEAALTEAIVTETAVPENVAPVTSGDVIESAATPAIIPSLILPNDTGVAADGPALTQVVYDVREVTGNRVNVRGGPGTNFGVVTQLLRGDAVEILEDNGAGWVRMRPTAGGPEGWMADFLLTSG